MTETSTVRWHNECDANFKARYEADLCEWMGLHQTHSVQVGERNNWVQTDITFDQALVMNGLHPTTSRWDPNPAEHVTIRLSTPALRSVNSWYTLHWRPDGNSVVLQQPDNDASNASRRARAKAKKQRRKERELTNKAGQQKTNKGDDGDTGIGSSSAG